MVVIKQKGSFKHIEKFLSEATKMDVTKILEPYGVAGVKALQAATPVDTGETANSWSYRIRAQKGRYSIEFLNSNIVKGVPIAIILQYGHATGSGGYVQGRDYINPALKPIFDEMAERLWKEVTKA